MCSPTQITDPFTLIKADRRSQRRRERRRRRNPSKRGADCSAHLPNHGLLNNHIVRFKGGEKDELIIINQASSNLVVQQQSIVTDTELHSKIVGRGSLLEHGELGFPSGVMVAQGEQGERILLRLSATWYEKKISEATSQK